MKRPDIIGEIITDDLTLMRIETQPERGSGLVPFDGENRRTRRAAVANFGKDDPSVPKGLRRQLWEQRKRLRRGKLKKRPA